MSAATAASKADAIHSSRLGLTIFGAALVAVGIFDILALVGYPAGAFHLNSIGTIASRAGVAALEISFGVGSMLGRRWARALSLCLGVLGLTSNLAVVPFMLVGKSGFRVAMWVFTLLGVFWNVALIWFYRLPKVKSTCETLDPVENWTDRRPLAVLACSGWLFAGGLEQLIHLTELSGAWPSWPRFLEVLFFAVFTMIAAVGVYRMSRLVWALYLAASLLYCASTAVSSFRHPFHEHLTANASLVWPLIGGGVIGFGYLICARRSFVFSKTLGAV